MRIVRKKARSGPLISAKNRAKRVAFAKEMLALSDEKLRNIVWSDETTVKSFPNGEIVHYWGAAAADDRNDIVSPAVQQGGISVQFWGCMSFHAMGPLVEFEGWVNGDTYLDVILKPYVAPEMSTNSHLVFQQDNAKPHKSKKVMKWLGKQKFDTLDWPPQSPDLSPIETIWNVMKMKLKALHPRPRNKEDISAAMKKIWEEMDEKVRQECCDKFREKLKRCLDVEGYSIFNRDRKHSQKRDCHEEYDSDSSSDSLYEE
jgi:transposase